MSMVKLPVSSADSDRVASLPGDEAMRESNRTLHIATYNIHKGLSFFNQRVILHELRDYLRSLNVDIIFLQEVIGEHTLHASRFQDWPKDAQYEFLADAVWSDFAYGKNAVYNHGHHGNAILSRFPISSWENEDISAHRFESRGLLHCELTIPGWKDALHCICVHLGLFKRGRYQQLEAIERRIRQLVPPDAPLVLAGDFNDWRGVANQALANRLNLVEVFQHTQGKAARSFPSVLPLLRLDRIYIRGFQVKNARIFHNRPWSRISDHAALSAQIMRK
ncbi:Metal-dependent hydrolase, endonuclease/exonuclease/phosphatase family [Nitrosomonas eutropha]|uniref:Metal-dependent hydrolase, endonuclease/exonuclease/phosphatase family n=2 Tax=Nitrosomonas eutropha TaxID=916 RepID=A0A1I7IYH0_9PROT|nr:Metal-dependent hydrolase, endonuclease/exonuclease/phosphatase family [Nitrosomonas eutropha]